LEALIVKAAWEAAIRQADSQAVRELLDRGIDVDARDPHGQTGLMLAAHAGHREVVETLLAHGAKPNITAKFGLTALMLAVIAGHAEVARLLARAGTDLSVRGTGAPGFAGKTAHDLALERGMLDLCAELKTEPSR
jgi:ankyrin repeat protein